MIAASKTPNSRKVKNSEKIDDEVGGVEAAQLEYALLGDDAADDERDQHDDRHAAQHDELHLMDEGGRTEMPAPAQDAADRHHGFAKEAQALNQAASCSRDPFPDLDQKLGRTLFIAHWRLMETMGVDFAEKRAVLRPRGDKVGAPPLAAQNMERAVDHPGADRVEPIDAAEVEHDLALGLRFVDELRGAVFDGERVIRRPGAGEHRVQHPPFALRGETWRARGNDLHALDRHDLSLLVLKLTTPALERLIGVPRSTESRHLLRPASDQRFRGFGDRSAPGANFNALPHTPAASRIVSDKRRLGGAR